MRRRRRRRRKKQIDIDRHTRDKIDRFGTEPEREGFLAQSSSRRGGLLFF